MQLAILIVLIIIAVILAPWLLGLIAIAIAAYGMWLVISLVAAAVISLLVIVVILLSSSSKPASSNTERMMAEVNEQFRAKEAAQRAAAVEAAEIALAESERIKKVRVMECPSCSATIPKHSLYCPQCGKSTKLRAASNE